MKITPLIVSLFGLILLNCSSPLDKVYNKETEKEDLFAIKSDINSEDYNVLIKYLFKLKPKEKSLEGESYSSILVEAQNRKEQQFLKLKKEYEDVKKLEQLKIREEEQKVEEQKIAKKEAKIKMICSGKWGMYYEKTESIDVSPELPETYRKMVNRAFNVDPNNNWILFNKNGYCEILDEEYANDFRSKKTNKPLRNSWNLKSNIITFPGRISSNALGRDNTYQITKLTSDSLEVIKTEKYLGASIKSIIKMKKN